MRPNRRGVSTYLEVFLLVGVAIGGSAIVMGSVYRYLWPIGGPTVAVEGATIRQGTDAAVESMLVVNTGDSPISSFVVTTAQPPQGATFCYTLLDPASGSPLSTTCPSMQAGPGSLQVSDTLVPGAGVEVELVLVGGAFSVGSMQLLTVTAWTGTQDSVGAEVVPA